MKEQLKILKVIHFAISAGAILIYALIGEFTMKIFLASEIELTEIIFIAIPVAAFFLSNFLFKSQLKQVDPKLPLEQKLPFYQTASVMRWAVLEGAALIILFIKPQLMIFGMILILYLVFIRPTENNVVTDLKAIINEN